jgi:hypothetical protein
VENEAEGMGRLIDRVGVAEMIVLRFATGVGLLLELKVWRTGLDRSSDEELKSSFVGVDGNVGDSGSAKALCGTSPGLKPGAKQETKSKSENNFFFLKKDIRSFERMVMYMQRMVKMQCLTSECSVMTSRLKMMSLSNCAQSLPQEWQWEW